MWCVHTSVKYTKGQGQDAKQKSFKKKKGHGKGGDQVFSALVDYFQNMDGDGEDDDNDSQN